MYNERRKVIKDAGKFRFIKITGQVTKYAIQYKYSLSNHDFHKVKNEMVEYLGVKHWQNGDWAEFYINNRKQCNKQFTMCVLKYG